MASGRLLASLKGAREKKSSHDPSPSVTTPAVATAGTFDNAQSQSTFFPIAKSDVERMRPRRPSYCKFWLRGAAVGERSADGTGNLQTRLAH